MQTRLKGKRRVYSVCSVLGLILVLFSGCISETADSFKILSASLAWVRKDWSHAASSFLEVTKSESLRYNQYASYGLASTYLAQEEYDAALFRLSEISETEDSKLNSGLWYQAGIIAWRKGVLEDASQFFRKSLEYDSTALDAKINLELIQQQYTESAKTRSGGSTAVSDTKASDLDNFDAIYNVVKKKEIDRWKNQEAEQRQSSVADY